MELNGWPPKQLRQKPRQPLRESDLSQWKLVEDFRRRPDVAAQRVPGAHPERSTAQASVRRLFLPASLWALQTYFHHHDLGLMPDAHWRGYVRYMTRYIQS